MCIHTAQQLLRGKLPEMSRKMPLRNPPWKNYYIPFEGLLEPEDVHLSGLVTYANMLLCGTTCFAAAGGPHPDEMARAAEEIGIRGFVALSTVDQNTSFAGRGVPGSMMMTTAQALDRNVALARRWKGADRRVQAWMSMRQIIVCTPELIRRSRVPPRRRGCGSTPISARAPMRWTTRWRISAGGRPSISTASARSGRTCIVRIR
jgi:5-methylthioadenosine/S-adenosylhomocysteine deaminase